MTAPKIPRRWRKNRRTTSWEWLRCARVCHHIISWLTAWRRIFGIEQHQEKIRKERSEDSQEAQEHDQRRSKVEVLLLQGFKQQGARCLKAEYDGDNCLA